jgi:hypothetical protein
MKPRRQRVPRLAAALGLLACSGAVQALDLHAAGPALPPAEASASRELLDAAVAHLPATWVASLDRRIDVQWRDDLPAQVHGRAQADRILLDRGLLEGWMARPAGAGTAHPATRAALAAVIHELAHFHDRSAAGGLSRDPRLLDLAGWQVRPLQPGRTRDNAFSDRSPDAYELSDPVEFVAVNLEHFLLDPEYACRRPALHRHFAGHFGQAPASAPCAPGQVFLQAGVETADAPLLQLDPARVYAVDYLLAEGNDRFMSRWGHSMLRLVVCAPGRAPGPDCRFDLQHHRVLSFRAFVDDVQISSWRGLTGSYPSRLFVLPLSQVVEEYTRVELRGLQSIPLRLGPAEITGLLERAARLHWSYDGRYYFVGNNCAVETFKLLHDGVPRLAHADLSSITPTGLLRRLAEAGIADTSVLADGAEARRSGYYFEPASAHYQAMFDVARQALELPHAQVQDWLDLSPAERRPWLEHADLRTAAALLLLENAALRRTELLARDELKRLLPRNGDEPTGAADALAPLREVLQLEGLLARPAALLPGGGYGLPQQAERDALTREAERHAAQWLDRSEHLRATAGRWLSPTRQAALRDTEANIGLLGARLRQLHHEAGGLQLGAAAD